MGSHERHEQAGSFLRLLFEESLDDGYLFSLFTLPRRESRFFSSIDEAVEFGLAADDSGQQVYVAMGLFKEEPAGGRGTKNDVFGVTALWVDIDIRSDAAHVAKHYPETTAEALALAQLGPHKPSMVVNSGHGLHAYWLFDEPRTWGSARGRSDMAMALERFKATMFFRASNAGLALDSVMELARVLRLPGTTNRKVEGDHRPVEMILAPDVLARGQGSTELGQGFRRFDFDELTATFVCASSIAQPTNHSTKVTVGEIVVDPNVTIPTAMLTKLREESDDFEDIWFQNREFKDQSPSSYDMAMANLLVALGFGDQEIVDVMIHWRREVANKPKNRVDYYQSTISKARNNTNFEASKEALESDELLTMVSSARERDEGATTGESDGQTARALVIENLRAVLGFNICRWLQYGLDGAQYVAMTESGEEITFQTVDKLDFRYFRKRVYERCQHHITNDARDIWDRVMVHLAAIVEVIDQTTGEGYEAPTREQAFLNKLAAYLGESRVFDGEESEQMARARKIGSPYEHEGLVWISRAHFEQSLRLSRDRFFLSDNDANTLFKRVAVRETRPRVESGSNSRVWYYGFRPDALSGGMDQTDSQAAPDAADEGLILDINGVGGGP